MLDVADAANMLLHLCRLSLRLQGHVTCHELDSQMRRLNAGCCGNSQNVATFLSSVSCCSVLGLVLEYDAVCCMFRILPACCYTVAIYVSACGPCNLSRIRHVHLPWTLDIYNKPRNLLFCRLSLRLGRTTCH